MENSLCSEYKSGFKDFYKTEFDETDLNFINVPGHLELQGFGSPQYVNTQYPWDGKEFLRPPQVPQESNAVASYVKHFTLNDALKDKKYLSHSKGLPLPSLYGSMVTS